MYDELVMRLRKLSGTDNLSEFDEAADAIEELSLTAESYRRSMEAWADEAANAQSRWIPVKERLPEDDTAILAHVYWPQYEDTMICYGKWRKGWCYLYHHVEGELLSGYVVTHWMPIPEPPKEE